MPARIEIEVTVRYKNSGLNFGEEEWTTSRDSVQWNHVQRPDFLYTIARRAVERAAELTRGERDK